MADSPEEIAKANRDELHAMRQDYDSVDKPVDHYPGNPVGGGSLVDFSEREKKDPKQIVVTKVGSVAVLTFGKQTLTLDSEGVKNAVRVFSELEV